jgi:hypothetical protein
MLARLGTEWNGHDVTQASVLLEEAVLSVRRVSENQNALWGQSFAVQEAGVSAPIELEKAALIASDLSAARARSWSLPLIAVEWNATDHKMQLRSWRKNRKHYDTDRDLQICNSARWRWHGPDRTVAGGTGCDGIDDDHRSWTQNRGNQ